MTLIAPVKFFFLEILNGLEKKTGGARKTRVFFLASSLTRGAYFITHHFQASQVFKSPALYNDQPPTPLLPARSLHIALFPLVHYFLYTRGKCVTLKQRSGQFTKLFKGVTRLHPPSTLFPTILCARRTLFQATSGKLLHCFENKMAVWGVSILNS